MMKIAVFSLMLVMLAACGSSSSIQRAYHSERNDCQDLAEEEIHKYINPYAPMNEKDRNAQLVTLFSDCMFTRGWTVATPSREKSSAGGGI